MSSETVISIDQLSKTFKIYRRPIDRLIFIFLSRFLPPKYLKRWEPHRHHVLKNVSLNIKRGETVGVVGINGSGKSTLLQIITGLMAYDTGHRITKGRIAAILELGSGLKPDLTGRENSYLLGAILGYSKKEIDERVYGISKFAELNVFFDERVALYSSGMVMRLAFAIHFSFSPDIMIVDEAFAVGDVYFQQKCYGALQRYCELGGTLILVSHDTNALKTFCARSILLSNGCIVSDGATKEVVDYYSAMITRSLDTKRNVEDFSIEREGGVALKSGSVDIIGLQVLASDERERYVFESETEATIVVSILFNKAHEDPVYGLILRDRLGRSIFEVTTAGMGIRSDKVQPGQSVDVEFKIELNIIAGEYTVSIGVANGVLENNQYSEHSILSFDLCKITVIRNQNAVQYGGICNLHPSVRIQNA
jgi:ABC-type polysaccharide/polyol phosphate transport system ATPase subunit